MSVTKKTLIGHIDLTPTWAQQAERCIAIIQEAGTPTAIEAAKKELLRMGVLLDHMIRLKQSDNNTRAPKE